MVPAVTTLAEALAELAGLVAFAAAPDTRRGTAERVLEHLAAKLAEATPAEQRAWCSACDRLAARRWRHAEPLQAEERRFYRALPAACGLRRRAVSPKKSRPLP